MVNPPQFILASQSPRRRQLLTDQGYNFLVEPASESAESGMVSGETPREFVARMAWQKAKDVANRDRDGWILSCDTVAECRGQVLGKPVDRADALRMLTAMSGQLHHVYSGVCLCHAVERRPILAVVKTQLRMDRLTEFQLHQYLDSNQWQGKAGAFGYQDGLDWVHIVDGSESNVVGLPMETVGPMLQQVGIYPASNNGTPSHPTR